MALRPLLRAELALAFAAVLTGALLLWATLQLSGAPASVNFDPVASASAAPRAPQSLPALPARSQRADPAGRANPLIALPATGTPTLTVRRGMVVELLSSPGGQVIGSLTDATEFDSPTVLSVLKRRGNWAGVSTQLLPNGELGWVKLDQKRLSIDSVGQSIVIDLSAMTAKLFRGHELERRWQVGIGAPDTPTPTGQFSITDEIEGGLNPTYGCCAIALSATQPNLPAGWSGGDRIAIHGTSLALGAANSTGCVHSGESDLHALMAGVPLGTPVTIKA
jgi:hypothetical protein